jgi:hypothetical protein
MGTPSAEGALGDEGTVAAGAPSPMGSRTGVAQAANRAATHRSRPRPGADIIKLRASLGYPAGMWILLLEALGALALLVFIVWWTMFSGRRRGEPARQDETDPR